MRKHLLGETLTSKQIDIALWAAIVMLLVLLGTAAFAEGHDTDLGDQGRDCGVCIPPNEPTPPVPDGPVDPVDLDDDFDHDPGGNDGRDEDFDDRDRP